MFEGADEGLAEWTVTAHDGQQMMLQMAYFDRTAQPVTMDVGPVLSLEDVVGGKVCALAGRAEPRDYIDGRGAQAVQRRRRDRPRPPLDQAWTTATSPTPPACWTGGATRSSLPSASAPRTSPRCGPRSATGPADPRQARPPAG